MKIAPVGAELFQTDGRRGGQTDRLFAIMRTHLYIFRCIIHVVL